MASNTDTRPDTVGVQQDEYEHGVRDYREPEYREPPEEGDDRDPDAINRVLSEDEIAEQANAAWETKWLQRARETYRDSTDYANNSLRETWERNWNMFRNEHANGSKYASKGYANRSKLFRPKLRSASTQRIAALSAALHSNDDLLSVTAADVSSNEAKASADVVKALVQYRLRNTLKWFPLSLGAFQSCDIYNVCISRQDWDYKVLDESEYEAALDDEGQFVFDDEGNQLGTRTEKIRVVSDKPTCELIMPENFRFDPNSNWIDPVGDSPYLIENMPMFAGDVLAHMSTLDPVTGQPKWKPLSLAQIVAGGRQDESDNETVRNAREGDNRSDPADNRNTSNADAPVWVRRYIIREGYTDYTFYTLGDTYLLTDPVPLDQVSKVGRNYVIGYNSLEVFRNYPASSMELGTSLAEEINDIANQRIDNVRLVLNKRYFIKRQKQGAMDLQSLMRNTPGGGVMVDDPVNDVRVIDTPDITSSSYQEHDRISVELDELLGNFSQASVQSNRTLNETVGGMDKLSESANVVQELAFKLFVETWVEPVITQLVALESAYEADETVLALAGRKAELFVKYNISEITDSLLSQNLITRVNVGMGHTNPTQKLQKLAMGIDTMMKMPQGITRLNEEEIYKEAWGYLGFSDGERFVIPADQVQQPDPMADPEIQLKLQDLERKKVQDQALAESRMMDLEQRYQIEMANIASRENITIAQLEAKTGIEERRMQMMRDSTALRETNKSREMHIKQKTGSGI